MTERRPGEALLESSEHSDHGSRTAGVGAGAAVLLCAAAAWALLANAHRLPGIALVAGAVVLALLARALPAQGAAAKAFRFEAALGGLLAAAVAAFFRLRYLRTLPIGYGVEPLNFLTFAQTLLDRRFPYVPYAWYAHTLYSYVIALTMLVVHPPLFAFRVASAAISFATVAALWFCLRELADTRAAWIGSLLLAISDWHLFASRDGLHQFLLPLFQLLFVGGLVRGLRTARPGDFLLAAVAMVLGLHSHWGFYLMPFVAMAMFLYLAVFQRDVLKRSWKGLTIGAVSALVLLVPLAVFYARHTDVFGYVLKGFSPGASFRSDLHSKLAGNVSFLLWTLSGNPAARFHAELAPVVDPLVATLAVVGLVVCLRRFAVSLRWAAPVLLLAANAGGLIVSVANNYYIVAMLAAVYCLAALGAGAILERWQAIGRKAAAALLAVFLAAVGWQARRNTERFFGQRVLAELVFPGSVPFYSIFDSVLEATRRGRVYMPRKEPERDFETMAFQLTALPQYRAFDSTLAFPPDTIVFPPADPALAGDVTIFLPAGSFARDVAVPRLRAVYPHASARVVFPPEPYRSHWPAVAYEVTLPRAEVERHQGPARGPAGGHSWEGLFQAPRDGRYEFRFAGEPAGSLWLDGRKIEVGRRESDPPAGPLLERGLHRLALSGPAGSGVPALQWRSGGSWFDLAPAIFNRGEASADVFAPYMASPGQKSRFVYRRRSSVRASTPVVEALLSEDGSIGALNDHSLMVFDGDGRARREIALPRPMSPRLARLGGRWLVLGVDGDLYASDGDVFLSQGAVGCQVRDVAGDGARLWVLCAEGALVEAGKGWRPPAPLKEGGTRSSVGPASFARARDGFWILDAARAELFSSDEEGGLRLRRIVPGAFSGSHLASDGEGNVSLEPFDQARRVYSPEGELLFGPGDRPELFLDEASRPLNEQCTNAIRFLGDRAVSVDRHDRLTIYVWQREPAP